MISSYLESLFQNDVFLKISYMFHIVFEPYVSILFESERFQFDEPVQ